MDKNCLPWSKVYLEENIVNTTFQNDSITYTLTKIDSVTGDCDVTQRKGKVLCIFDMKLEFSISGTQGDEEFTGKIILPEFIHDQEDDEYDFTVNSDTHKAEIRKHFVPVLKAKLMKFQGDLISAHSQEIQSQAAHK